MDQLELPFFNNIEQDGEKPTQLATTPTAAPILPSAYSASIDYLKIEDIAPPQLRLAQGLSAEVMEGAAKVGQWIMRGYPPLAAVTVVIMAMSRKREYRSADVIQCVSADAQTGVGNPGGECVTCEMARWSANGQPQCIYYYSYVVYIVEHDTLAILNFKRTAIGVAKSINSALIKSAGFGRLAVKLTSKSMQSKKGIYYTPVATIAEVSEDVFKRAQQLFW